MKFIRHTFAFVILVIGFVGLFLILREYQSDPLTLETDRTTEEVTSIGEDATGNFPPQHSTDDKEPTNKSDDRHILLKMRDRFDTYYDPMIVVAREKFTDAEIQAYNDLHVLPFNPVASTICEEGVNKWGGDYKQCSSTRLHPPHAYESLDTESLATLAEHDAEAALILANKIRLDQPLNRLRWFLQAAALSGKPGPVLKAAQFDHSSFTLLERGPDGSIEQIGLPDTLIRRLALETLAAKMGDPRAEPGNWRRAVITNEHIEDPEQALTQADKLVAEWLEQMDKVQRNVTGSTQMFEIATAFNERASSFDEEIELARRQKSEQDQVMQFRLDSALDLREYIVGQIDDTAVYQLPQQLIEVIERQIDDLEARAKQNRPLTQKELEQIWQTLEGDYQQLKLALKKTDSAEAYLEQMRYMTERLIHERDLKRETLRAARENRAVNYENVRYHEEQSP